VFLFFRVPDKEGHAFSNLLYSFFASFVWWKHDVRTFHFTEERLTAMKKQVVHTMKQQTTISSSSSSSSSIVTVGGAKDKQQQMKKATFVSTNDVLCAYIWKVREGMRSGEGQLQ
jgi:hypothetical protein